MKDLLEHYKRKLDAVSEILKEHESDQNKDVDSELREIKLLTKRKEYRLFIVDIQRAISRQGSNQDDCTHEDTEFQHLRCNVCSECGEAVEIDV